MSGIGSVELLLFIALALLPASLIYGLWKKSKPENVDAWASAHDLVLTERTRPAVSAYLRRNLRWRTSGAIIGVVLPLGTEVPGLEMLIGYLVGAILGELTATPILTPEGHQATLSPRELGHYVPIRILNRFRALCVITAGTALAYLLLPLRTGVDGIEGLSFVAAATGAIVVLILVEVTLRYIVRRRQPAAGHDVVAADDALRSAAMHATLGAGTGIAFLLLGAAGMSLGMISDTQILRWLGVPIALICLLVGLAAWLRLGHDTPWVVRRPSNPQVQA